MGNVLTIGIGAAPNDGNGLDLRDAIIATMAAVNGVAGKFNSPTPPASLTPFQDWFDTSTTPPTLRYFDGTIWVPAATLDPNTHTFASLASPSGAVGGDLSGTLPSPVISALAVTNAKMAAGAAAANVGALGGDFSGTLPAPTIAKIQGIAVSGVTGTGNAVLSAAPTITGAASVSSIPFNPSISPPASFSPPAGPGVLQTGGLPFYIAGAPTSAAQDSPAGTLYVSKNTNYTGSPNGSPPAIYGANFVADGAQGPQVGVLGYVANNNTTGSQPGGTAGAVGIYGIGAMASGTSAATWGGLTAAYGAGVANPTHPLIGLEVDVYDIGTDSHQTRVCLQLNCSKGLFSGADPTCTNMILAGGTVGNFINYAGTAINGLNMNGATFSGDAIATPGFVVDGSANVILKTVTLNSTFTIAQLLAIASPATGQLAYVSDTVFSAAPTLHGTIAGAGSTTAKGIASYNGANWQWC